MSAQLLQSVLDKLTDAEIRALAAAAGIELPEAAPAPKPQRDETMRQYALSLGVEVAADPAVSDDAVRTHLKVKLAAMGLTLADPPAEKKPAAKKGSAASRKYRRPNKAQKTEEQVARRGYAWVKPTTPRTGGLDKGSPIWNYYIQGDWTWLRTTKEPSVDQLAALKAAGFAWSTRRAAFFAEKVVTLDRVHNLLVGR